MNRITAPRPPATPAPPRRSRIRGARHRLARLVRLRLARVRRQVRWLGEWLPLRMLQQTVRSYGAHACGIYAGAMAFFGTLALFPLVLLLITLFTIVIHRADASELVLNRITTFFPGSTATVVTAIDTVTAAQPVLLGVGTVGLLWSSMGVFLTLGYALNRIWEAPRDRPLLVQYAIAAGLALSVGLVVLVSELLSTVIAVLHALTVALARFGVPDLGALGLAGSNALDFLIVGGAAAFLFWVLPNIAVRRHDVLLPAALVAVAWEVAKVGFTWYLSAIAHVSRIYGPVAAVAGLMLWLFISSIILLLGAELSHQLGRARGERGNTSS